MTESLRERRDAFDAKLQAYQATGPDRFSEATADYFEGLIDLFHEGPEFLDGASFDILFLALKCIAVGASDPRAIATATLNIMLVGDDHGITMQELLRDEPDAD